MDEAQAGAAQDPTNKAAASTDADKPQIDLEAVTLDQLDTLYQTGKAELPVKSGEDKAKEAAPAKADEPPPKKEEPAGDEPPAKPEGEEEVVEIEESRTPEEIEEAVSEAVEAVKADGGDEAAQEAAAEAARQPVAKAEDDIPPKKSAEEEEEESEVQRIQRPRLRNPVDQQIAAVFKAAENSGNPISWAEAERRVKGEPPKPEDKKEDETPELTQVIATLETEVTDLKAKLDEAGGDEALFTKEIAQWTQQLAEKTADLKLAKRDLRDAQELAAAEAEEANTSFKALVATSRAKAIELYPDVADEKTKLGKAVTDRIAALRDKNHPDHSLLFTGTAPEKITRDVADELGIQPVAKKKAAEPPPKKEPVTPKPKKMTPASGAKSTAATAQPSEEAKKKTVEYLKSDDASLEDLDNAFGAGTPSRMLQRVAG